MNTTLHTDIHTSAPIFADDDWNTQIGDQFTTELLDENGDQIDAENIDILTEDDATTEAKWDEAEDRLLARNGLTRADVTIKRD